MSKWGERPHWEMDAVFLGADSFGEWLGFPAGTHMSRPGRSFTSINDQVGLLPAASPLGRAWIATFHAPGWTLRTYVDMTTPLTWSGSVARAVDLDLDVVEGLDHVVHVDDEDEFAEHSALFDYPPEVVSLARTSCDLVLAAVRDHVAPFDGAHLPWLDRLASLTPS